VGRAIENVVSDELVRVEDPKQEKEQKNETITYDSNSAQFHFQTVMDQALVCPTMCNH
jgi:hypothetical protein